MFSLIEKSRKASEFTPQGCCILIPSHSERCINSLFFTTKKKGKIKYPPTKNDQNVTKGD